MNPLVTIRGWMIRGLRRPLAAGAASGPGRAVFRAWLKVLGGPTTMELHGEMLDALTERELIGQRGRLIQRLRHGARELRFTPEILQPLPDSDSRAPIRTLVLLWSLAPERVASIVHTLQGASGPQRSFVPVFVTDCDDFDAFRQGGSLFEYIPARRDWVEHHGPEGWEAYVTRRIEGILMTWDPDRVLLIDDADGDVLRQDGLWPALTR